ncbi:peptide-N(4)-(N-acetyl-beta-glucosaminyl)asparagine amidase [Rhodamnia argentea]|uniref:Peptide-N(4)-(N-acetyl-beta-glucosaminyl)asparagine amidase n=1 Tax=Rhodamnia argentea TaxID=178133 RepID=A0A8B8PIT9_9MYRT|nr:peptide-N(4)-(N-acetyl-beta-glucosaminyl)asparagine amidase [Rhodamnia argentea]XP_048137071.1 peptide-N(4)-(N-acetyl-beta-glucosaminyl)asparagine amidase [Rhodamnia argentea]
MVARRFQVRHNDSDFEVDYDTDDGLEVFRFQLFSLTSIPPDEQRIVGDGDDRVVSEDSDLVGVADKLRLVSIDEEGEGAVGQSAGSSAELLKSDEELARLLQAEEEALLLQQFVVGENSSQMEERLRPYIDQVRQYEDPKAQEAARKTVPVDELEEKALVSLAKEGNFKPSKSERDHAFLIQLLYWFKRSFSWVNAPPCEGCGSETVAQGSGKPLPSELLYGGSRVEIYRCKCSRITRFPRYNDPMKLLETRRGRCGEWANCFTFYCCAFGYESRLVFDFTDHVWTECFSVYLGRWMHLDPCEGVYDKPLLYEKGWNKKLNYAFGIAKDGIHDVTKRYTKKWHEVLTRRNLITETSLSAVLAKLTKECRRSFTSQVVSALEDREKKEMEAIERDLHAADDASVSLPGRQSGDKEWRVSRSEIGSDDKGSLSCSSCPVRVCFDGHVTRIYDAFSPVLSLLADNSVTKFRALEVLETFKQLLEKMRRSSFKTRRVSLDSASIGTPSFVNQLLPSFSELLNALSLKCENLDGKIDISLAGDPVKTSLALPVVVDALEDMIQNLRQSDHFSSDVLSLPLLKSNRIHSGSVLASGEELPLGIATAAFDGTRETKWEEPNGGRGCWIMFKVPDGQMKELVAYDLMSANDAPERDPMNWIVEGSSDGGSSWHVLDERTSQLFENRFERRTFKIKTKAPASNSFRFRFLAVRDVQSTSRLQLGSIDLYARRS